MARLRPLLVALALPALMAPGRCGFAIDYTETVLIPDDAARMVLNADDGSIVATSYDRQAILLKRHTFGFEPSLGQVEWFAEDDVIHFEAHCKYEGNCTFDHMLEVPLNVDFEISMMHSEIELGYWGGDIDATFDSGSFTGIRLASKRLRVDLADGDVSVDYAVAPESVTVELDAGDVALALPPGAYQCNFDAGGEVETSGEVTCDAGAAAVLDITVRTGNITVKGAEP